MHEGGSYDFFHFPLWTFLEEHTGVDIDNLDNSGHLVGVITSCFLHAVLQDAPSWVKNWNIFFPTFALNRVQSISNENIKNNYFEFMKKIA